MKINSIHQAAQPALKLHPKGLSSLRIPPETRLAIESECLEIFASMANTGASLQASLLAIYLSGMSAAHEAAQ